MFKHNVFVAVLLLFKRRKAVIFKHVLVVVTHLG